MTQAAFYVDNPAASDEVCINACKTLAEKGVITLPEDFIADITNISGNINRTCRIIFSDARGLTREQRFIVKMLPPGGVLEKYPDISFPESRLTYENYYYDTVKRVVQKNSGQSLCDWIPEVIGYHAIPVGKDVPDRIQTLVFSDLYPAQSLQAYVLNGHAVAPAFLRDLGYQLGCFHKLSATMREEKHLPRNPSADTNRPYVLTQPFLASDTVQHHFFSHPAFKNRASCQKNFIERYGSKLLRVAEKQLNDFKDSPFQVLTHGDLHADSVFFRKNKATVIDAEFCDWGAAWFDTGMVIAHLWMLSTQCKHPLSVQAFTDGYQFGVGHYNWDWTTFWQQTAMLSGFEVIRRIIGLANMPYLSDDVAARLLESAASCILQKRLHIEY